MKNKEFWKFILGWTAFLVGGFFCVFLLVLCSDTEAQEPPYPDTPFTPYKEVQAWEFWEYVDAQPEEKVCDQVVEVSEPSDIKTICFTDTHKVLADDGVTVQFMLLPAGCVAIIQYRLKIELDVYQDKHCDILFHNKGAGYQIEKEEQPKIGV